jgi:hypothetical protein
VDILPKDEADIDVKLFLIGKDFADMIPKNI